MISHVQYWVDTIKQLATVKRFSQAELAKPENVLEHTGMASLICLNIGERLLLEGHKINMESLLKKSLIHDIEESLTGDMSKTSKYFSTTLRGQIAILEKDAAKKIFKQSGMDSYVEKWSMAKSGKEGSIVSFVDTLCAMIKFHDEIIVRGNKSMIQLIERTAFESLLDKIDILDVISFPGSKVIKEYVYYCVKITNELEKKL